MGVDPFFSDARIVLEDGTVLQHWKEYALDSDFLTPTDGWSFSFGTEVEWLKVKSLVVPERKVVITIDGQPQVTGWIDKVHASCSDDNGVMVSVEGRDFLMPLVKGNIHPATRIKNRTLADLVASAVEQIYQGTPVAYEYDNDANRQLLTGAKAKHKSKRKRKETTELEYCQAHVNESAFEFCARNLRRFGLWLWASGDGKLVIGAPNYDQPASYQIMRKRGDSVVQVEHADWTHDRTNIPSLVWVRGRSQAKDWSTQKCKGIAQDSFSSVFCPMLVSHDEATTDDECLQFAWQELARVKQDEKVYTCTLKGHRDPRTGLLYAVDTIAHVEDEPLGINDDLWVIRRTFRKSADGGTFTDLKLVPKGAITFSDVDAPQ